jgi:hypothetical protein
MACLDTNGAAASYSGGSGFKHRLRNGYLDCVICDQPSSQVLGYCLRLDHDHLFSHYFPKNYALITLPLTLVTASSNQTINK